MYLFLQKLPVLLLLLSTLLLGACSKTPLKDNELQYVGYWKSYNGSTLEIMANGGGSGKKLSFDGNASSSKEMSGAQVLVNGPVLSLKLMGMTMDYHVDAPPAAVNGKTTMKLDGMEYEKMN